MLPTFTQNIELNATGLAYMGVMPKISLGLGFQENFG